MKEAEFTCILLDLSDGVDRDVVKTNLAGLSSNLPMIMWKNGWDRFWYKLILFSKFIEKGSVSELDSDSLLHKCRLRTSLFLYMRIAHKIKFVCGH